MTQSFILLVGAFTLKKKAMHLFALLYSTVSGYFLTGSTFVKLSYFKGVFHTKCLIK